MNRYETWVNREWSPTTDTIVAGVIRRVLVGVVLITAVAYALGGFPWAPMATATVLPMLARRDAKIGRCPACDGFTYAGRCAPCTGECAEGRHWFAWVAGTFTCTRPGCGDVLPLRYGSATCVREQGHDGPHRERLAPCYTSGAREWTAPPPCHLEGCPKHGQTGHHHHYLHGHENTTPCTCRGVS